MVPIMPRRLWCTLLIALGTTACEKKTPPTPSPGGTEGETITGRERIGWDQQAAGASELATFRYAIYVDNARSEVADATCATTAGAVGFACSGRLPAMVQGSHTLELAAFVLDGDVFESPRSTPLRVNVQAATASETSAVAWSSGPAGITSDGVPLAVERVADGLADPTDLAVAPDGRVFVAERFAGRIRVIRDGVLLQTPLATFADTATTGEQGLLGLALDPGFPQAPWLYAYQTYVAASGGVSNRIVRVRATDEVGGAPEPVLDRIPASTVHNGGVIGFGPDGKLYALVGDAQDANAAQDLRRLNGKVIRLNADGSVPSDNPFFGQGNANPYVYTYGHRNMFGLAFHPATGTAYITENGPQDSDEVNLLVPGGNYGWPVVRGTANRPPYIDPIATWTPTIAPTNAAFPTGSRFASFEGDLVLGDWNTGTLRRLDLDPPRYDSVAAEDLVMRTPDGILEMEPAPDGSIWFTTPSAVFRWAPSAVLESLGIHVPSAGPPAPGSIASWRTVPASAVSTAPRVTLDASRRES